MQSIQAFKSSNIIQPVSRWEEYICLFLGLRAENMTCTVAFSFSLIQWARIEYLVVTQLHLQTLNFN